MGHTFSSQAKKEELANLHTSQLTKLYQSKMFCQNKKSQDSFMKQINDLLKKLSYLQHPWAQQFLHFIQHVNPQRLYSQYEFVLQENCRRDGCYEIIFFALKLRELFLKEIVNKYNTATSILTINNLKQLIYQTKSYFMVLNWLHRIGSLDEARSKDFDDQDNPIYPIFVHQQKVYNIMIDAASRTYVQYLEKQEISKLWLGDIESSPQLKACQISNHLRQLRKCKNFHDRQKQIICLQQTLSNNQGTVDKSLYIIQKVFGRSKIFGYLLVIKELGHFNVCYLWKKIYGNNYNDLFH